MDVVEYWHLHSVAPAVAPVSGAGGARSHHWLGLVDDAPSPVAISVRSVDASGDIALSQLLRRHPPPQADGQERTVLFEVKLAERVSVRLGSSDKEVVVVADGHGTRPGAGAAELLVAASFLHRSLVSIDVSDVEALLRSAARCVCISESMAAWTDLQRAASALTERASAIVLRHPGRVMGLAVATSDEAWEPHLGALSAASKIVQRCVSDVESHVFPVIPMVLPAGEPRGLSLLLFLSTPE